MKIKTKNVDFEYAMSVKRPEHKKPKRPNILFRTLVRALSVPDLLATNFSYTKKNIEKAGKGPYLILMNHSSFIDLKIAYKILYPTPFCTICTTDGFVGKAWLMRNLGCIPTQKYVTDVTLVRDMLHTVRKEKTSILMFPEACYTLDGRSTPLPQKLGMLLKKLDVPVMTIITDGAFLRDPLYNELQLRKVKVSAEYSCLLSREEIAQKSVEELDKIINDAFSFDNFKNQYETNTIIDEPFRADGLHRVLYRCPNCNSEGKMLGKGIKLTCQNCEKSYKLTENGRLCADDGNTEFEHIPDWFDWQRNEVIREIESGTYHLESNVKIAMLTDYKALYMVGEGKLTHDRNGFRLVGCNGKLDYFQPPSASYELNADYFWYEIDDIICIGNRNALFYCFTGGEAIVAKARLATEELYKMYKQGKSK